MKIDSRSSVVALAVAALLVFVSSVHAQGRTHFRAAGQLRGASVRGGYALTGHRWYGHVVGFYGFPYFGWGYPWYPPYGYYPYPPLYGSGPDAYRSNGSAHVYDSHPVAPDYGK